MSEMADNWTYPLPLRCLRGAASGAQDSPPIDRNPGSPIYYGRTIKQMSARRSFGSFHVGSPRDIATIGGMQYSRKRRIP
jgi:hypothetical protein